MNHTYPFNLLSIANILSRKRRLIILITVLSGLAGFFGVFLRTKKYEAKAEFFLKNPFYADRNFLYNSDARYINYFADDDDVKRLSVLVMSDSIQRTLINEMNLAEANKVDTTDVEAYARFKKSFSNSIKVERTDNKSVALTYLDKDAKRAANVANRAVKLLEQSLQYFYSETRIKMYEAVLRKIQEEDVMIATLTDSLVNLRNKYGIFDIISPARYNIMLSSMKSNGNPEFARGLELVQNIESLKDEMVTVRARNLSLSEQYSTGTAVNELPLIYSVKSAVLPVVPEGPGKVMTSAVAVVIGFFFICLLVLITGYYRDAKKAANV